MAIIKRVQADSGQTAPNDSVSGDDLTGATGLTLVDRGADGFAWRFGTTSGDATVAISPAFNLPSNPSPDEGVTILMRYRLNTLGNDSSAPGVRLNVTSGDVFDYRKNGSSGTRGRWGNLSNAVSTVDSTLWSTGITRTLILRLTATSGVDNLDAWWNVASRPNNDPNFGVTNNGSTSNFNELLVGNFGNSEVEWFDVIVDDTPLTNAQCAAAADDLRGQYPLPTSGVSIIEQPVDQEALVNTGLVYDFSSLFDEGPNTPVTYTTNLNPSLGSIDSVARTLTIDTAIKGTIPSTITGITITATDSDTPTPNQVTTNGFSVTWDSTAWGVLGSEIPNTPAGATGPSYLFQSIEAGEENDRFRTVIVSDPADGFLLEFPDTSFVFSGAPDGTYTFVRQIFKNDVAVTPNLTATMTVGEAITETRSPQVTNSVVAISVPGAVDATITENRSSQATSASARFPFEFPDGAKIIYVKRQN